MTYVRRVEETVSGVIHVLPKVKYAEAKKLLIEARAANRNQLGLEMLSILHLELSYCITTFPPGVHGRFLLQELKSYRLAFACSIEERQARLL